MRAVICLAAVLAVIGCAKKEAPVAEVPPAPADQGAPPPEELTPPPPQHHVTLAATKGNEAAGTLDLTVAGDAVKVTGSITGLKADTEHGFHIHEKGDCSAPDAESAGGHFNPASQPHGDPNGATHHAGDIPNVKADAEGTAQVDAVVNGVTMGDGGANDIVGKAFIVHQKADDYKTQPSGNSGKRIACGVIE
jgi:Cu-Zn family superoxide dismutase